MNRHDQTQFNTLYLTYINELKLQGKSDKTIECYSRALRQVANFFDTCPNNLSVEDLKRYFLYLVDNKSWSAVKIARNAIQFCYKHVVMVNFFCRNSKRHFSFQYTFGAASCNQGQNAFFGNYKTQYIFQLHTQQIHGS